MNTILLEEMTSPKIREAIEAGYKTVIIPAGAIEQHGKHLPIGTDVMYGTTVSVAIAKGIGDTLLAPIIRPGCSDHHMPFSGTISISFDLLKEIVRTYCHCLHKHGFERMILLATHGGNIQPLLEVALELDEELPCRVVSPVILGAQRVQEIMMGILHRYGVTLEEGGIHSGFIETAIMLGSSYSHLVDMKVAERGFVGDALAEIQKLAKNGEWSMSKLSPNGILGDATKATAQAGEELNTAMLQAYIEIVKKALD
jgi:creatinine amidohydrolase